MRLFRHRTWWFPGAWLAATASAFAACGRAPVIDWGLHRQWRVECDAVHPEQPARLVEVPWSARQDAAQPETMTLGGTAPRPPVLVRPATRVALLGGSQESVMHLCGTALEAGTIGATIRVRAGWNGTVLRGIVRGTGVVELLPERGRH